MLEKIDMFVLNLHQEFSDMIRRWVGLNNFFSAKLVVIISVIIDTHRTWLHRDYKLTLGDVSCHLCVAIVSTLTLFYFINRAEKNITVSSNSLYKNPLEYGLRFFRVIFLLLIIFATISSIWTLCSMIFVHVSKKELSNDYLFFVSCCFRTSLMYFVSCTPKPPTKSKLSEFFSTQIRLITRKAIPSRV